MPTDRSLRWRSAVGGAAVLVAAGVLFQTPLLVGAAAVPVVFLAGSLLSRTPPEPEASLSVERELGAQVALPGDQVEVRLAVENRT
ncbi:MAG: DUF58 domain-containing protein, partial [Halodesulfurarchaeum sp.]